MTLDEHLSRCAAATGLRPGMQSAAHRELRAAFAVDAELARAGRDRLSGISDALLKRDHVSRWLKATLEGALPKGTG